MRCGKGAHRGTRGRRRVEGPSIANPRPVRRTAALSNAGGFGVIAVVLARVIHGKTWLSPWLVLGLLPTVVGLLLI